MKKNLFKGVISTAHININVKIKILIKTSQPCFFIEAFSIGSLLISLR